MSYLARVKQNNYFLFEIFAFLRLVTLFLPRTVKTILIQDKICLVNYNQSEYFCRNIQQTWNSTELALAKDNVLSEASQFSNYTNLIESIAMVIWSLFVGSFLDRFPAGSFIMLSLNIVADIFVSIIFMLFTHFYDTNAYYLLIASFSAWFTGGLMAFVTTAFHYITVRTEENSRVVKFVTLEVIFVIGGGFAIFLGGQLLRDKQTGPQIRTYNYAFVLMILLNLIMIGVLVLLIFVDRKNRKNAIKLSANSTNEMSLSNVTIEENINSANKLTKNSNSTNVLSKLFDINNVKQTIHCFVKRRPNNVRLQIYLLCIVLFNKVLVTRGLEEMLLVFVEKVYSWTATHYSTIAAVQKIVQMAMMGVISLILMKLFKLQDRTLMFISMSSVFLSDLVRGLILTSAAFMASIPIGAMSGLGAIAIKAKLSKIIPEQDLGKIFSLSCTIEALVPFAASLIYSNLFSLTISSFPGVIYLFSCGMMIFSIGILFIEWRYCPVKTIKDTMDIENK